MNFQTTVSGRVLPLPKMRVLSTTHRKNQGLKITNTAKIAIKSAQFHPVKSARKNTSRLKTAKSRNRINSEMKHQIETKSSNANIQTNCTSEGDFAIMSTRNCDNSGNNTNLNSTANFEILNQAPDDTQRINSAQMENLNMELSIHAVGRGPANFTLTRAQSKPTVQGCHGHPQHKCLANACQPKNVRSEQVSANKMGEEIAPSGN